MSLTVREHDRSAPKTGRRLLHGLSGATSDPTLETHLERWGAVGHRESGVLEQLAASGLVGHGGAWFPVSTKWESIARGSR